MAELGQIGGSPLEGQAAQGEFGNASVKSRIVSDNQTLKEFQKTLEDIGKTAEDLEKKFDKLFKKTKDLNAELKDAVNGGKGGKGKGSYIPMGDMPEASKLSNFATKVAGGFKALAGGGGAGGGGGGGYAALAQGIATAGSMAINAMDKRIDENRAYSLSADRLSLVYQQTQGISGGQYRAQYRAPLTQYKLGAGGINELLALQAQTGISAAGQAGSVEALRAISGYGYSTGQMANMLRSMGSAQTANRMFMTMGTGLYGIGGQQRSALRVFQDLTNRLGLTNKETIKGAYQAGSATRQRMAQAGLDENMQTLLLQYAESNVTYKGKGGAGMYDPSKKGQRQLMGTEENFATQVEETERVKVAREEKMYSRQTDNYADLEKATQRLTEVFGALEDKLSGIIGARASTRPYADLGGSIFGGIKSIFGMGDGMDTAISNLGNSAASYSKMTLAGSMSAFRSSGTASTSGSTETYNNQATTNYTVSSQSTPLSAQTKVQMTGLNSSFKERLDKMLRDRPGLGLGSLIRDYETQKQMFLGRYHKTDKETKIYWDGAYWEKNNDGQLPAAPPGMSYHERGLAADLTGSDEDIKWMWQNAEKYGLKAFKEKDPPHVELQGSLIPSNLKVDWSVPKPAKTNTVTGGSVGRTRGPSNPVTENINKDNRRPFITRIHPDHGKYSVPKPPWTEKDWDAVAWAETHQEWTRNGGEVSGGLGISDTVWKMFGGKEFGKRARNATRKQQILVANRASWTGYTNKDGQRVEPVGVGGFTTISVQKGKNIKWPSGDGMPTMPSPSRPTPQRSTTGGDAVYNINVSPNITISSTGSPSVDIRQMAREVAALLDKEIRLTLMRSS